MYPKHLRTWQFKDEQRGIIAIPGYTSILEVSILTCLAWHLKNLDPWNPTLWSIVFANWAKWHLDFHKTSHKNDQKRIQLKSVEYILRTAWHFEEMCQFLTSWQLMIQALDNPGRLSTIQDGRQVVRLIFRKISKWKLVGDLVINGKFKQSKATNWTWVTVILKIWELEQLLRTTFRNLAHWFDIMAHLIPVRRTSSQWPKVKIASWHTKFHYFRATQTWIFDLITWKCSFGSEVRFWSAVLKQYWGEGNLDELTKSLFCQIW